MRKIRLLIVDDHAFLRRGLISSLSLETDLSIVGEASNGEEALAACRVVEPDLVIMDWQMPRMSAPEVTELLHAEFPLLKILILSAFEGDEHIYRAAQSGVLGYVLKSSERDELLAAIRAVAQGKRFFPAAIASKLAMRLQHQDLTDRERQVLGSIAKGLSNKEIADVCGITEGTVKIHVTRLLMKLDARDRAHAACLGIQRGILRFE